MALINSASKSSRLLASRRYTHDTFTDAQESFTNVLDLRAEEIYTQAQYIPSTGLPFSGSSQHGSIQLASGSNLMKYWYRHKLTPSNVNTETWFFINPTGSDDGVGAQLINDNQEVNFISPKYSVSSLANAITEDATPGYGVVLYKSSTYTQTSQTGSLSSGDKISVNDYIFDYKTGVVQFLNSSVDPATNEVVFMTAYQYVGTTLATGLDIRGDISASNMLLTGNLQIGGDSGDTISITAEYSGSLIPDVDDAFDLGKSSQQWKDLYVDGVGYIDSFDAVTSTGIVSGSAVYGTILGQNTTSGLKIITIESDSTINQDLTTDANVLFAVITGSAVSSSGDVHGGSVTSTGTISGSSVYGTIIGQNRVDGLKTITIEANSTINQDVSTDAAVTFATVDTGQGANELYDMDQNVLQASAVTFATVDTGQGANELYDMDQNVKTDSAVTFNGVTSTGTVSGSAVYGTTLGQNRSDGLKTITIEANSIINQDLSTDATATLGTLAVGNVTSTGIVSGSSVYGTTIGQNRTDGLKTITIEANSIINQDVSTDADATLGTLGVGNVTSTGTVSGSAIYGTTIGQNRTDGLKTITIESNSTVNQDLTTDANVQFAVITGSAVSSSGTIVGAAGTLDSLAVGNVISSGTITGSSGHFTTLGQNTVTGVKTISIEANSIINQDLSTDADATLGTLGVGNVTSTGIVSGSAVYGTLLGQNRTDGLKTITIEANSIINQDVSTDADATLGTLSVGNVTSTATVSGSAIYGTTLGQNTTSGLKTITIESNSTVNQDLTTDADVTFGSLISGSADLFVGAAGGNYVSASGGNLKVSGKISASSAGFTDVSASTAEFTTATITGGTITGITDITVADGGTGVSTLTDGGVLLGSGTDPITAMAVLADSEMIVGDGSTDPVAESGTTLRTSIGVGTGDSPQFTGVTATGTITGSAVYGTTIGQNRIDGVKTITIESNSTVNQDLTTDASPTFDGLTLTGNTLIGTLSANRNLIVHGDLTAQNYIVSSSVTHLTQSFSSGSTIFGDSPDDTHRITGSLFMGTGSLQSVEHITGSGVISGSEVYGTTIGQNRSDGLKTITIESNSTINQDVTTDATPTFDGITSTGTIASSGLISGSGNFWVGDQSNYISGSTGNLRVTGNISGSAISASTAEFTSATITGGTITGITDLVVADGGTGASTLTDGGVLLGSGTSAITAMAVLSDGEFIVGDGSTDPVAESGATLRTSIGVGTGDTPQFTGLTATGTITGSAVYGTTIGQNTTSGLKTITIESNSTINQDLTTDANVQFAVITGSAVSSSGNITGATISGSAIYGTTIGQNRVDGLKTITIEANSIINQDVTTDATPTFNGITSTGTIASSGLISGSGDLWVGDQSNYISGSTGNVKISGKISASSAGFTDVSASTAEFTSATITGGTITGITDLVVADGGTGASTLTDGGILLGSGTDPITAMSVLSDGEMIVGDGSTDPVAESGTTLRTSIGVGTGDTPQFTGLTATGTVSGSAVYGTLLGQNTTTGVKTITIEANSIINQDLSTDANATLGTLGVGNVTSTGTVSGSAVYGTTLGQNRVDGLKTITIESNSTINQDVTTDATPTFGGATLTGDIKTSGVISGSSDIIVGNIGGSHISGSTGNLKVTDSLLASKVSGSEFTGSSAIFDAATITTATIAGGTVTGITDITVADGGTGVSTLTDGGILLGSGTGAITATSVLGDGEILIGDGSGDPVALDIGSSTAITTLGTIATGTWEATDVAVAHGGTGASTLTDGGVLLGSGTDPITAMAVLGDGEFIVGDGSTDPVAESGTTLRTSIGVGTGDSPTFTGLTLTGDLTVQGDTTTLSTTNLQVGDAFIFAATGSAASNVDGGLIVQSGSAVDSGSAIYHDTQDERWAVAKGVASDGTAVTPTAYVSTITTANHNPNTDSGSYGSGEMWVNTTDEEIWVRTG